MMNKPLIAIVSNGGLGNGPEHDIPSLIRLVDRLNDRYTIHIFSMTPAEDRRNYPLKIFCPKSQSLLSKVTFFFRSLLESNEFDYQFVQAFWGYPAGLFAILMAKGLGVPSIVTLMGGETANLPSIPYGLFRKRVSRSIITYVIVHSSHLIVLTHYQMTFAKNIRKDYSVIPFGAELYFKNVSHPRTWANRFGFVGNINEVKNINGLLEVFKNILRDFPATLKIIGSDHLNGQINDWIRDFGKKVTWTGKLKHKEVAREMLDMDILIHPALYEGQGVAIAEAAASGVIPVGSAVGILADWSFSGIVDETGTAKGLTTKILSLLSQPELRVKALSFLRSWSDAHSAEWTAQRYADIYENFIAS